MRVLWVVEMKERDKWVPTVGASLTKRDSALDLRLWRQDNPDDKYRVRAYTPRDEDGK